LTAVVQPPLRRHLHLLLRRRRKRPNLSDHHPLLPIDAATNYAKKRIRRVGSSEIGAEEEAKDDAAVAAL